LATPVCSKLHTTTATKPNDISTARQAGDGMFPNRTKLVDNSIKPFLLVRRPSIQQQQQQQQRQLIAYVHHHHAPSQTVPARSAAAITRRRVYLLIHVMFMQPYQLT